VSLSIAVSITLTVAGIFQAAFGYVLRWLWLVPIQIQLLPDIYLFHNDSTAYPFTLTPLNMLSALILGATLRQRDSWRLLLARARRMVGGLA